MCKGSLLCSPRATHLAPALDSTTADKAELGLGETGVTGALSPKGGRREEAGTRGDWRKRLGRGAWNNQSTFQLRTGCGELPGAQVVKRRRNILTPDGDREKPGLRAESSQTGRALRSCREPAPPRAQGTPSPQPPHLDPALRLRPVPLRPRPWVPPRQPCLLSSDWTQSPHPISSGAGPSQQTTRPRPGSSGLAPRSPGTRPQKQVSGRPT